MRRIISLMLCVFLLSGVMISVNAKTLSDAPTLELAPANAFQDNTYAKDGYCFSRHYSTRAPYNVCDICGYVGPIESIIP